MSEVPLHGCTLQNTRGTSVRVECKTCAYRRPAVDVEDVKGAEGGQLLGAKSTGVPRS